MTAEKPEAVALKPKLSLLNGVTLIVGKIIGSGIFISPKGVHAKAGSVALSLILWLVGGLITIVGALCYAEYGTTITKSGANYAYILCTFGKFAAFVRLWASVALIEPSGIAVKGVVIAKYLTKPFYPSCKFDMIGERTIALIFILFLTAMNCLSVKYGTRIQNYFAYTKVIALVVIIAAGIMTMVRGGDEVSESFDDPWLDTSGSDEPKDLGALVMGIYKGLFAYNGWDTLNYMTEELKDPYTNLPRAIYISLPLCIIIYLLTNISYYVVLSPELLVNSEAVAITFAEQVLGPIKWLIPIVVAASVFGSLNASIMTASRLFYTGARENQLPGAVAMISIERKTPLVSIILTGACGCLFCCIESVGELINYFIVFYWFFIAVAVAGMLYLKWKEPNLERPLKVHISLHILFAIICVFLVVMPFVNDTVNTLIGMAFVVSGIPIYYFFLHKTPHIKIRKFSRCVTLNMQKLFVVAKATESKK